MPANVDVQILQGATFTRVWRWGTSPIVYKTITAISKTAPVVITATGHDLPEGWWLAITGVHGMTDINAKHAVPRARDYVQGTVLSSSTIAINSINAADFSTYTSGGVLQYWTPVDLASFTARMQFRPRVDSSTVLLSLTSAGGDIVLDNTAKTITTTIAATATEALSWKTAVYDLELISGAGVVTRVVQGKATVSREVTR